MVKGGKMPRRNPPRPKNVEQSWEQHAATRRNPSKWAGSKG